MGINHRVASRPASPADGRRYVAHGHTSRCGIFLLWTGLALGVLGSSAVRAQSSDGLSGHISLHHNYQFQGTTYNLPRATPQVGIRYGQGHWSVGAWAGEIRYPGHDDETIEYDLFVGYQRPIGLDQGLSISVWRYHYVDAPESEYDYTQLLASWQFRGEFTVTAGLSNNQYKRDTLTRVFEVAWHKPWRRLLFTTTIGHHGFPIEPWEDLNYLRTDVAFERQAWLGSLSYTHQISLDHPRSLQFAHDGWSASVRYRF